MTIASTTQLICFVVLSATLVLGALGVVLLPNIVYSAFLLGGVFLSVAGLYLMLNASFVAAAQVLVYVGAVNVLILFAIMLVNKKENLEAIPGLALRRVLSGAVCAGLFALLKISHTPKYPEEVPELEVEESDNLTDEDLDEFKAHLSTVVSFFCHESSEYYLTPPCNNANPRFV